VSFGLVLGGGGPVGAAWYAGLALGLEDHGVELAEAELVLGSSAGAWVGAWLTSKSTTQEFCDSMLARARGSQAIALDWELIALHDELSSTSSNLCHPRNGKSSMCRIFHDAGFPLE
jgi:NTE family protein